MRRRAKIDTTQTAIVKTLRQLGASVYSIGKPVDLLIGWRGRTYIAEVKACERNGAPKPFKACQAQFFQTWAGALAVVLTCEADARRLLDTASAETLRPTPEQLARIRD